MALPEPEPAEPAPRDLFQPPTPPPGLSPVSRLRLPGAPPHRPPHVGGQSPLCSPSPDALFLPPTLCRPAGNRLCRARLWRVLMTARRPLPLQRPAPSPLGSPQLPFWLPSGGPISRSELTPQLSSLLLFAHVVPYTRDTMASPLPSDILSTLGFILKFHLLQGALPDACSWLKIFPTVPHCVWLARVPGWMINCTLVCHLIQCGISRGQSQYSHTEPSTALGPAGTY